MSGPSASATRANPANQTGDSAVGPPHTNSGTRAVADQTPANAPRAPEATGGRAARDNRALAASTSFHMASLPGTVPSRHTVRRVVESQRGGQRGRNRAKIGAAWVDKIRANSSRGRNGVVGETRSATQHQSGSEFARLNAPGRLSATSPPRQEFLAATRCLDTRADVYNSNAVHPRFHGVPLGRPGHGVRRFGPVGSRRCAVPRASGFTWTELLVVLAIIGTLFVLLIPAQRSAREPARIAQCRNNLKMIGLALHNYHDVYGSFPPPYTVDASGRKLHSWRTLILPYLDQGPLYKKIDLSKPWDDPANETARRTVVPVYHCPSLAGDGDRTTYMAVVGSDGVFRWGETTSRNQIRTTPPRRCW